jgi:hypothetical protein
MDTSGKLLKLLDQPPSKTAWAAFADAVEKLPDSALVGLLPDLQVGLAAWPDHLRVAREEWAVHYNDMRLAVCRVVPFAPALSLADVFNSEMDDIFEAEQGDPESTAANNATLDIGNAYFLSSEKYVRGLSYSSQCPALYVLESVYPDWPQKRFPGYDHLYRINYQTGACLRLHSFVWKTDPLRTRCLLIKALAPDRVLLVTMEEKDDWLGQADVYLFEGSKLVFEHHRDGCEHRRSELPQYDRVAIFCLSDDLKHLWGYHQTKDLTILDLETLVIKTVPLQSRSMIEDMVPCRDGVLLVDREGGWAFVDKDLRPPTTTIPKSDEIERTLLLRGNFGVRNPQYDFHEAQPAGFHVMASIAWHAEWDAFRPQSYLAINYKRLKWDDWHIRFRSRRVGANWRCAYLNPPEFKEIIVLEFPTGLEARLCIHPAQMSSHSYYQDGNAAFDFDQEGAAIVFDRGGLFFRWVFVLQPGDVMQRVELNPT